MKKAIKGLSLAMGIASMTANMGAMNACTSLARIPGREYSGTSCCGISSAPDRQAQPEAAAAKIFWFYNSVPGHASYNRNGLYHIKKEIPAEYSGACEIKNGLLGMNRDVNMPLTTFFKADSDIREIFCVDHIFFKWKDHFLFKEQRIAPLDHIYNAVKNYNGGEGETVYMIKNGLFYISIDLLFRRGTSRESLFDLFLNYRNIHDSKQYIVRRIFRDSLVGELMRLNGDPKALSASFVFNAMKNGYSLDQLKDLEEQDGLIWFGSCSLDITTVQQSSSSSSSSSSTAMGVLNLSSSSDSIGHQSLLDKFKSIDLFCENAITTSSSSKSTPEGSVCSSSNESSISFAEEQKGKLTPESIIALLRKKVNSAVPTDIYLIQKNLCCLPLSKWLEPDLIAGGFLEEFFARTALEMMLLSTIDRLFLENGLNPKRVADILETTRDSSERNLIDIIIQCAEIDRNSAFCILRHYFISTYEIPFSKETSKKIKTVRRNTAGL